MKKLLPLILGFLYFIMSIYAYVPLVFVYYKFRGSYGVSSSTKEILDMYKNPLSCYAAILDKKIFMGWLVLIAITIALILTLAFIARQQALEDQKGIEYLEDNGTHGTAGWLSIEKAKEKFNASKKATGIIFGKVGKKIVSLAHPSKTRRNWNILVLGASGSGKSYTFAKTNILQTAEEGHSLIITDPKGELFADTANILRDKFGYNVKSFNLVSMEHSDRWNPLSEVKNDLDAQKFVEVIIANTDDPEKGGGDQFWENAEKNLLKALVLYVVNNDKYSEGEKTLATIYSLIAHDDEEIIDKIFKNLPSSHPAKMPYNVFKLTNEKVRSGVITGLGTRLQLFQNKLVQELTSTNDLDLTAPGQEKCAYFCIIPDTDQTFRFLSSLFFSFLFINLINYADKKGGRGEQDVVLLMDEFVNIGKIPDFQKKIATIRSRCLHAIIIIQGIGQLKDMYEKNGWNAIVGNCDTKLFLGANDLDTAEYVSKLLGTSTVRSLSKRKEAGFDGLLDYGSITQTTQKRNLLNPDEVLKFPEDESIIFLRGMQPLKVKKMPYKEHKYGKLLDKTKMKSYIEYIPKWKEDLLQKSNKENEIVSNETSNKTSNKNQHETKGVENSKSQTAAKSTSESSVKNTPVKNTNDKSTKDKKDRVISITAEAQKKKAKKSPKVENPQTKENTSKPSDKSKDTTKNNGPEKVDSKTNNKETKENKKVIKPSSPTKKVTGTKSKKVKEENKQSTKVLNKPEYCEQTDIDSLLVSIDSMPEYEEMVEADYYEPMQHSPKIKEPDQGKKEISAAIEKVEDIKEDNNTKNKKILSSSEINKDKSNKIQESEITNESKETTVIESTKESFNDDFFNFPV